MKRPLFIRFLAGGKLVAKIYPTPAYAGRHLMADVEKLALLHGRPVRIELGTASPSIVRRKPHNPTLFPMAEYLDVDSVS